MKKKGVTFIETVVAITIFLIGIIPVAMLTLNSMSNLQKSSEIEEGARVASTVINYIKSRGYSVLIEGNDKDPKTSKINWSTTPERFSASYVLTSSDGTYISSDFEDDFYGKGDAGVFFIESLGIDLEGAKIDIAMEKANLNLAQQKTSTDGTTIYYDSLDYKNFISDTDDSSIIIGNGGLLNDPIIYGLVKVSYTSKAKPGETSNSEEYKQTFVVTPLENFNN